MAADKSEYPTPQSFVDGLLERHTKLERWYNHAPEGTDKILLGYELHTSTSMLDTYDVEDIVAARNEVQAGEARLAKLREEITELHVPQELKVSLPEPEGVTPEIIATPQGLLNSEDAVAAGRPRRRRKGWLRRRMKNAVLDFDTYMQQVVDPALFQKPGKAIMDGLNAMDDGVRRVENWFGRKLHKFGRKIRKSVGRT